jgi:probable F420-dependent oxidoreductase
MKVDRNVTSLLPGVGREAYDAEIAGYDGIWTAETTHDPFLPLLLGAEHTTRVTIGTSIADPFARTPMLLANLAWDLQAYSNGRLILGLGSQIEPCVPERLSVQRSSIAARMRELVQVTRAIWNCWLTGDKLDFRGDFYSHMLMPPFFAPGRVDIEIHGAPKIFLVGVEPLLAEIAGEVADGYFCHAFTTERYLREVTLPALRRGRAKRGRTLEGFEIMGTKFVVTGVDEIELGKADLAARSQISFLGSTPAYRPILDLHGWGDLQPELHRLSKLWEWDAMRSLIDDQILTAVAAVGGPDRVAGELTGRLGDVMQRVILYAPYASDPRVWQRIRKDLQGEASDLSGSAFPDSSGHTYPV